MKQSTLLLAMSPSDKKRIKEAADHALAQGIDVRDNRRGGSSMSAFVRYLVNQYIVSQGEIE